MTGRTSQRKGRRCSVRGCKRRPAALELCNTHLLQRADAVFSQYIRKRDKWCRVCHGPNAQTMHIISRRYRGLRFDPRNAIAGCAKCHVYYEHRDLEWQAWINEHHDVTWAQLRREALDWEQDHYSGAWRELAVQCIETLGGTTGNGDG